MIFLSPYSYDYDPIEWMFAGYKACLKRHFKTGEYAGKMNHLHLRALLKTTLNDMLGYIHDCGCYRNVPAQRASPDSRRTRATIVANVVASMYANGLLSL